MRIECKATGLGNTVPVRMLEAIPLATAAILNESLGGARDCVTFAMAG